MSRITGLLGAIVLYGCSQTTDSHLSESHRSMDSIGISVVDTATFAGGCFWCTEAHFRLLAGIDTVISGYTGGTLVNPSYKQVTTGKTGHAEAVNVVYRPAVITYEELLTAFFAAHDPTQLNRQGNDIGTQYRSAIFYRSAVEKKRAAHYIKQLREKKVYNRPIVTTLEPYTAFYAAEDYHQDYFNLNPNQAYCQYVIVPKLESFKKKFSGRLAQ